MGQGECMTKGYVFMNANVTTGEIAGLRHYQEQRFEAYGVSSVRSAQSERSKDQCAHPRCMNV